MFLWLNYQTAEPNTPDPNRALHHLPKQLSFLDPVVNYVVQKLLPAELLNFIQLDIFSHSKQDDYRVCLAAGVFEKDGAPICPVDASGKFTSEVTDFVGQYVKVVFLQLSFYNRKISNNDKNYIISLGGFKKKIDKQ